MNEHEPITDHPLISVELVEVIRVVFTRGDGVVTHFRDVTQYWSTDGTLLAEQDKYAGRQRLEREREGQQ